MSPAKDRTGEECPFCKKGKLFATGGRGFIEPSVTPKSGETRREDIEYECDCCHKKSQSLGLSLVDTVTTDVKFEVTDKIPDEDKKAKSAN